MPDPLAFRPLTTSYWPGPKSDAASKGLSATVEGGQMDAFGNKIWGQSTLEDYLEGKGPGYVTVAMDEDAPTQRQFLRSPQYPGVVFKVMDNGGYGNGRTGLGWVDIAHRDPEVAKSFKRNDIEFEVIDPETASRISRERGAGSEAAGSLRAVPTDVGDTLEAQRAPNPERNTFVRYRGPGNDPSTPMGDAALVPMNDALNQGTVFDTAPSSKPQAPSTAPSAAAPAFQPSAPPWKEIRSDGRYRDLSQKDRHATFDKWLAQASIAMEGQPQEIQDRFRRKADVEKLRIDVEDPEATILDAYRRGVLNSRSAKAVGEANDAYRQMEDLTGNLVRTRLKLRPGEAVYYGPSKALDLPEGTKARILEGTTEQGLYAVPPATKGALSLEEFATQSQEMLHQLGQARQAAVKSAIENGELAKALPQSRQVRAFMEAEGGKASAKTLFENFGSIAAHTLAESAPSMVAPIAGGLALNAPGAFLGGFEVEYANSFRDFLEEEAKAKGIDTNTEAGLMAALADEQLTTIAGDRAAKRAGPIAGVDAISAGLAGLLTKKIVGGTLGKVLTRGAVQGAVDTPAGAAGELAAQTASGQEIDYKAATLESIGQLATGVGLTVAEAGKSLGQGVGRSQESGSGSQGAEAPTAAAQGLEPGTYESAPVNPETGEADLNLKPLEETRTYPAASEPDVAAPEVAVSNAKTPELLTPSEWERIEQERGQQEFKQKNQEMDRRLSEAVDAGDLRSEDGMYFPETETGKGLIREAKMLSKQTGYVPGVSGRQFEAIKTAIEEGRPVNAEAFDQLSVTQSAARPGEQIRVLELPDGYAKNGEVYERDQESQPYHSEEEIDLDPVPVQPGDIQGGLTDPGTVEGDIRGLVPTEKERKAEARREAAEMRKIRAKMKSLDRPDTPFNLAGEETRETRFEVPDLRSQEQIERDAGQSFALVEDDNIAFTGIPLLTPSARRQMRATNADRSTNVEMRLGLPKTAFEAKVRAEGRKAGILKRVDFLDRRLRRALVETTGKRDFTLRGAEAHDTQLRQMQRALTGQIPINRLPAKLRPIALEMRAEMDALSQALIDQGVVDGDLALAIADKKGTYLNRSYRVYDDPDWARKVPVEVRNRAKGLLRRQVPQRPNETQAQYENRIEGLIDEQLMNRGPNHPGPIATLAESSEVGKMVRKSLKQRKDIPVELRELWGEYETADVNFARSMAKVAQMLASHQFLIEVRETGLNNYLFEEPQPGFGRQIVAPQGPMAQAMEPIAGLWTTPEVAAAFEAMVKAGGELPTWLTLYQKLNSLGKIGKTVGNPITHVRNFTANILYSVALGNVPFRHGTKAMHAYIAELLPQAVVNGLEKGVGYDAKAAREYLGKMVELGVVDENVAIGDLNATMKEALGGNITIDEFTQNRLKRAAKKPVQVAMKLYAAEDGFWKIVNFEAEKGKLRRAFPDRTDAELDTEAAMLVREMTPTYSLVYNWAQSIRRFPMAGPFIAFFAEVARNNVNIFRRAQWEMRNDGYRAIGARRLAGLLLAHAAPLGIAAAFKMDTGLGDDEERAMRRLLAPWDQNALLVPLGKDKNGDWRVLNLSYVDPFATFKKTFIAAMRGDYANDDEMWKAAMTEALGPILQEELLMGAIMDIMRNKKGVDGAPLYPEKASDQMKIEAQGKRLTEALEPGAVAQWQRIQKARKGEKSSSGKAYSLQDEMIALFTGQRITTLDPLNSLGYRASAFSRNWREASGMFSRVAKNKGTVTAEDLQTAYTEMMGAKGALMIDLGNDMRAAVRLHETTDAVIETVRAAQISEDNAMMALEGGQMREYQLSDDVFNRAAAIPGRISLIRQAIGDKIFTEKQLQKVATQQTAQKILAPVGAP